MADRQDAADRTGPFKTNWVRVEKGCFLAPGYDLHKFEETEVGPTGHHKLLRVMPSNKDSAGPCFLGRWDKNKNTLDFDLADRQDYVQPGAFYGHHSTALGDQRFDVELGPEADNIAFKGIVSISLGFGRRPGGAPWRLADPSRSSSTELEKDLILLHRRGR